MRCALPADRRRASLVESSELERPAYVATDPIAVFTASASSTRSTEQKRSEWQLRSIVNGTNVDDLGDYRPGLEAAKLASVRSPSSKPA